MYISNCHARDTDRVISVKFSLRASIYCEHILFDCSGVATCHGPADEKRTRIHTRGRRFDKYTINIQRIFRFRYTRVYTRKMISIFGLSRKTGQLGVRYIFFSRIYVYVYGAIGNWTRRNYTGFNSRVSRLYASDAKKKKKRELSNIEPFFA